VVEQTALRAEERAQHLEVLPHPLGADVLEHADRRDGVERLGAGGVELAVVLQPDLDQIVDACCPHPRTSAGGLLLADGDPDHPSLVALGGVQRERTPTAADVEQPATGRFVEPQLPADQVVLAGLRLREAHVG
jgi:hypothetical protein